jgi:serine O-acetyltransferase
MTLMTIWICLSFLSLSTAFLLTGNYFTVKHYNNKPSYSVMTLSNGESPEASAVVIELSQYKSPLLEINPHWNEMLAKQDHPNNNFNLLWEQIELEARAALGPEPEAGPQIYQAILSQPNLTEAIVSVIAHEIETELIKATELHNLFLQMLTEEDKYFIHNDVVAAATRSPSIDSAITAVLFHTGLHALVCYRVGHRLWQAERNGLSYYLQSTVSRRYSADIHPACKMGSGIYLCSAAGVVIGETARIGNDVSILHGVTLGGTGKERGDRHPKVGHGVLLEDGATVLGNIPVGDGAVVTAKSIVTRAVEPLAVVSGVPAKQMSTRSLKKEGFVNDLDEHLSVKYLEKWKQQYT